MAKLTQSQIDAAMQVLTAAGRGEFAHLGDHSRASLVSPALSVMKDAMRDGYEVPAEVDTESNLTRLAIVNSDGKCVMKSHGGIERGQIAITFVEATGHRIVPAAGVPDPDDPISPEVEK